MAIIPINFSTPSTQPNALVQAQLAANAAARLQPTANATAAAAVTGTNQATLGAFGGVLGQVLAQLGPLAFDTTLTTIGGGANGTTGGGAVGSLTNTVFDLLLLNTLGVGPTANQPGVQQLLVTQLLLGAVNSTDSTGLGSLAAEELAASLTQQQQGTTVNPLLAQLATASTQPSPIVFSAGALAQAFQMGNGLGLPA